MGPDFPSLLRGFGKFLAVVIASVVAGALLGIGLSKLTGGDEAASPPLASAPAPRAATSGASGAKGGTGPTGAKRATGATGTTGPNDDKPQSPRIRVLSSILIPATTTAGRQRRRARVAVRLRVTARDDKVTLGPARLISGDDGLKADTNAKEAAGDLLDPIASGKSATGALRFETSGALTGRLTNRRRATLRIGDRTLSLRLTTP